MSVVGVVRLHENLILFEETFGVDHGVEAKLGDFHYVSDQDGNRQYVFFLWCSGDDLDAFDAALAADGTVTERYVVTETGEKALYCVRTRWFPPEQPLVFPLFRKLDVTVIEARRDADGLHLQARFPSRDALREFRREASAIADRVNVERLYVERAAKNPQRKLTGRQREALVLAYDRGYFETPSQATLEDLSAEFGVTPQTLSRHIRDGVEKLVEDAVAEQ
ncbi:helix-turn-helix domain-containing protein [Halapricum hydrolyticum]|uniref:Helix-turn-helix domain-containing protein n=1 Tax=Halapricum hydrolyticum TaxID=2979991 RepID=A0AAE3ID68_9EURY|nr:helix-turn-helix domain-containing protein [Halapricum hydrolyticum]MCU4719090.1 helix-turn-helix domain-containing protein [Halapricum hydrolyticum]MCU4728137.1 helix-turn-helix domain-containing protein [Halapricum hydrolyticum]